MYKDRKKSCFKKIIKPFWTMIILIQQFGFRELLIAIINKLCGLDLLYGITWIGSEHPHPSTPEEASMIVPAKVDCVVPAHSAIAPEIIDEFKDTGAVINSIYAPCLTEVEPVPQSIKKRILVVSHELSRTGAPRVLLEACKVLCRNGYFVTVLAPRTEETEKRELAKDFAECGIHVIFDKSLLAYRWKTQEESPKIISPFLEQLIQNYDLLLCNSFTTHNVVQAYSGRKIPVIWWLHEGIDTFVGGKEELFPRNLQKNVQIYCVSDYSRKILHRFGIECEAKILSYGIPDRAVEYPANLGGKIRFVLCGLIGPRKNQMLLLDAVKLLPTDLREKAEFILVGGHNGEKYYRKVEKAAEKLGCVSLIGSISNDEVLRQYQSADCIVLPSIDDPLPVVLTEGMMLSKIILCSDMTGTASLIEDGVSGYIFNHKDAGELSHKLEFIIRNARTAEMDNLRQKARAIYENNFTCVKFEENLLSTVQLNNFDL